MKRHIIASKVDTFLKYHDDESNFAKNPDGFDRMYEILDKYDTSNHNDTVDIAFMKATPEDQDEMIRLITPELRFGQSGYAKNFYKEAQDMRAGDTRDYCYGILDAFEALFKEGFLDPSDFE